MIMELALDLRQKLPHQVFATIQILVTVDIMVKGDSAETDVAFKNCAPFMKCITRINDEYIDDAKEIDIVMSMYNLTEYIDNYSDTSGRLW